MCTVSFLPRPAGFLLATNRDERRERGEAEPPELFELEGQRVCAPRDADAGGTWILATEHGTALCLLNGGPDWRDRARPDAPSRGLLLHELARDDSPAAMHRTLVALRERGRLVHNMFRLLVATIDEPGGLTRLSWDGERVRQEQVRGPHVETSSGFDAGIVNERRQRSFQEFLRRHGSAVDPREALDEWHRTHLDGPGVGDIYSVCMHHDVARTVSYTRVEVTATSVDMTYRPGAPCRRRPAVERALGRAPRCRR